MSQSYYVLKLIGEWEEHWTRSQETLVQITPLLLISSVTRLTSLSYSFLI